MKIDKGQAFCLRQQGKTFKQISEEMGCSASYMRSLLSGVPKGGKDSVVSDLARISQELMRIVAQMKGDVNGR